MSEITFEQYTAVEIRVGQIKSAEKVEKSEKLLRLEVDFGEDALRTVISGIAPSHLPEFIVNKKFLFVTNLAPRKIMGIVSQAMIFGGDGLGGEVVLCSPAADVKNGTRFG